MNTKRRINTTTIAIVTVMLSAPAGALAQTTLFSDDFNGPTLNSVYQASLPNPGTGPNPTIYLGAPDYSFGTVGGATVLRLTDTMNNHQSRGWSTSTTFNVDQFRFEVRFNTLNQGPSISIDNFIEALLIDPTNPLRTFLAAADDGVSAINRQLRTWNGIENVNQIQAFNFLDNSWYRLVLTGGFNENIHAALVADDGTTELVGRTFAFNTSIFSSGFEIGLGQSTGVPNKDSPLDVAVDWVRLTGTVVPEPAAAVQIALGVVLGGLILRHRRGNRITAKSI